MLASRSEIHDRKGRTPEDLKFSLMLDFTGNEYSFLAINNVIFLPTISIDIRSARELTNMNK
jgi:hypothetical protein